MRRWRLRVKGSKTGLNVMETQQKSFCLSVTLKPTSAIASIYKIFRFAFVRKKYILTTQDSAVLSGILLVFKIFLSSVTIYKGNSLQRGYS